MGKGAFINLKNWSTNPVKVAVSSIYNMDNGGNLNTLAGTIAPGASCPSDDQLYIESSGWETSTFNITISDMTGHTMAQLNFTEQNFYRLDVVSNNGFVLVSWFNKPPADVYDINYLNQAYINITIMPMVIDQSNWMGQWPTMGNLSLSNLAIPGTHDTGTYQITSFLGHLVPGMVKTQDYRVVQQLTFGARFFDIRPGGSLQYGSLSSLLSTPLYHNHSPDTTTVLDCAPLGDMMNDIAAFAKAHPKEIIHVALSHFTTDSTQSVVFPPANNGNNPSDPFFILSYAAIYQIVSVLGDYLIPNTVNASMSLQDVWNTYPGKNVIIFVELPSGVNLGTGPGQLNISQAINCFQMNYNNWGYANTDITSDLLGWIQNNIRQYQTLGSWNLLQCQLTPNAGDVLVSSSFSNVMAAATSNPTVEQMLSLSYNPKGSWAEIFACAGNMFIMDGYDGTQTNWAVLTNLVKLLDNTAPSTAPLGNALFAFKRGQTASPNWYSFKNTGANSWSGGSLISTMVSVVQAKVASSGTQLCMAYKNMSDTSVKVVFSNDGQNWSTAVTLPSTVNTLDAPSPVYFRNTFWVFYHGSGDSHIWFSVANTSGVWNNAVNLPASVNTTHSPAPVVFNSKLYMVFKGATNDSRIFIISSVDGGSWQPNPTPLPGTIATWTGPAAIVFNNKLVVAWKGADNANIYLCSSPDGVQWGNPVQLPAGVTSAAAPALQVFNNQLYVIYEPLFQNNHLLAVSSQDGVNWSAIQTIQ